MTKGNSTDQFFFLPGAPEVNVTLQASPAPTGADAARLLRELEREHEKRLVEAMRLDSNHFKSVAQTWLNPISGAHVVQIHADLNGRAVKIETEIGGPVEWSDFLRQLGDLLARRIADEILAECIAKLRRVG